ncbi:MAG: hypothetical protein IJZ87_09505 [Bacteroidales bacterium]|nr:hypothetical protein [Bacteroidales bacterium]
MKTSRFLSFIFLFSSFCLNAQEIKIGDLYTFDDNTKGVVFYVDEKGHGLAVSLNQEKRRWEEETHYVYCQNIAGIADEQIPYLEFNYGLGKVYTAGILMQLGDVKPTAAKYCRENGIEWYLPSAGELYQLITANATGIIDETLKDKASKPINGWYWTSSEYNQGEAWRINQEGKAKRCSKLATRVYARAVRQF